MPPQFLGGTAAAAGIALINSIGNLGGFVGPALIGALYDVTGGYSGGLLVLTGALVIEAALVLALKLPASIKKSQGLAGEYIVEVGKERHQLKPGDSVLGPRRVPHAFAFVGNTPGRLLVGFTPAGRMEQFFRDLEARGTYFGTGTNEDRDVARQRYGIVNVGPSLAF